MSLYAIGDVQGCYDELCRLLEQIAYDSTKDELWFTGDLINRGPKSLETLNFVQSLGDKVLWVLGNHELHLLSLAANVGYDSNHTLTQVLNAPNAESLLDWVASQPLVRVDEEKKLILVHAGLLPQWNIELVKELSSQVSKKLQSQQRGEFLADISNRQIEHPRLWRDDLTKAQKLDIAVRAMTRIRFCYQNGELDFACKEPPGQQAADLHPWYRLKHLRDPDYTILFGHWAAHGYQRIADNYIALDSACVWGGRLTAYRLDKGAEKAFHTDCPTHAVHSR